MMVINAERALLSLRQSPVVLDAVLTGVTPERAREATDGPGGWNVVGVVCHLRDYERVFFARATLMLEADNPTLPAPDPDELASRGDYATQDLATALAAYHTNRRRFLGVLTGLGEEGWGRRGVHPRMGTMTILELALHVALHDVNHIEQIVHTLARPT